MAKAEKKKPDEKKKRGKYDEKLAVEGSFMDIMKSAVKHREKNTAKKKDSDN